MVHWGSQVHLLECVWRYLTDSNPWDNVVPIDKRCVRSLLNLSAVIPTRCFRTWTRVCVLTCVMTLTLGAPTGTATTTSQGGNLMFPSMSNDKDSSVGTTFSTCSITDIEATLASSGQCLKVQCAP